MRFLFHKLLQPKADGSPSFATIYSRLYKYIRPYLFRVIVSLLITLPIGCLDAAIAFSFKPFLDGILTQKQSMLSVSYIPFIIVGFTLVQGLLTYLAIYLNGWVGYHIVQDLRAALYEKLHTLDVAYFDRVTSGGIIQRFYSDPGELQATLLTSIKDILTRSVSSLALMGVLIYTSWKLAIIAIFCLLCILFPATRIRSLIKELNHKMVLLASEMLSFYNETTAGVRVIYSYNQSKQRLHRFNKLQRRVYDQSMRLIKTQGWLTPSMHIIASIGIAIVIWAGTHMVTSGEMTTGAFVSFFAALIMLYNPIKNLGGIMMSIQQSQLAAARVLEILDMEPSVKDKPDAKTLAKIEKGIEFDHVSFEYVPDTPVLQNINLMFRKGETVALVGNSGGGKTTIASLIARFYDVTGGAIQIDGVDIRDYSLQSLRNQISLVMQDNFLFNGTIRDNLLIGNPNATEEEIMDAIDKAYLSEFVATLSDGLETVIGERGILLSGGQRQRLAIARAILKNSPIVILDEATSALDNQSEAIVQKAIESLMLDRTVIVIAHRLSTIRNANRIVVVSEGRIVEEGTHQQLLAQGGVYANLYNTQFKMRETQQTTGSPDMQSAVVPV